MYKLFIVEDEWFTRNALIREIPWAEADCEVAGDAADGTTAAALIAGLKPDVVISDIKMDGMDGIALCEQIRNSFPEIRFIIITGHGEFAYAQTAVKLGVKDFILKPTQPEELMAAVKQATREIENEKLKKQEFARLQQIIESNIPVLREKFLQELLTEEGVNPDESAERLEFLKIKPAAFYTVCMAIDDYDRFVKDHSEKERQLKKLVIKRIGQEVLDKYQGGYILNKEFNLFVMLAYHGPGPDIFEVAEEIQTKVSEYLALSVSLGISPLSPDFTAYRRAFGQAAEALQYKFYLGETTIVSYEDIHDQHANVTSQNIFEKSVIVNCLKVGDADGALGQLKRDLQQVEAQMAHNVAQVRNAGMELAILVRGVLLDRNSNLTQLTSAFNFDEAFRNGDTLGEIHNSLAALIRQVAGFIRNENSSKNSAAVEKIIAYLKINYATNIGLENLAQLVYMNPKYICRLLKKETGQTFLDILTEIRIDKAKDLMTDLSYKTYEVAQMVGINDARYFSQMFKKIVGMTPTEYREGGRPKL